MAPGYDQCIAELATPAFLPGAWPRAGARLTLQINELTFSFPAQGFLSYCSWLLESLLFIVDKKWRMPFNGDY